MTSMRLRSPERTQSAKCLADEQNLLRQFGMFERLVNEWDVYSILMLEEILHQLIGTLSHYLYTGFYTSHVVQDFFHQQYDSTSINWLAGC